MVRFNRPQGWPPPPAGQMPPASFTPLPSWPAAPPGWPFYLDDAGRPTAPPPGAWIPPAQSQGGQQSPVSGQPSYAQGPGPAYGQTPGQPPYGQGATPPSPAPAKKRTGLIIGLIGGVVALALIAGLAIFLLPRLSSGPVISAADVGKIYNPPLNGLQNYQSPLTPADYFADSSAVDSCYQPALPALRKAEGGYRITDATTRAEGGWVLVFPDRDTAKQAYEAMTTTATCFGATKTGGGSSPTWASYRGRMFNRTLDTDYWGIVYGNTLTVTTTAGGILIADNRAAAYKKRIDSLR